MIDRITLKTDTNGVSPVGSLNVDGSNVLRKLANSLMRAASGASASNIFLAHNAVAANAVLTFTGAGTALDTITIGNIVITLVTSGATGNQINIGASASATAANLAAFINAGGNGGNLSGICSAVVVGAVVTLTAAVPGAIGNGLQLAISSTSVTITDMWGVNIAGSDGNFATFSHGS